MENFLARVCALQTELKAPKGQVNKFGGYKFRSCEDILEAVKPLLNKYRMALSIGDKIVQIGNRYYVCATAVLRDTDSDATIENSAYAREAESKKGMDDSQITGTASSYARKYALNGLFCIDDTKDADTDEYAKKTAQPESAGGGEFQRVDAVESVVCDRCSQEILPVRKRDGAMWSVSDMVEYSKRRFGFALCEKCMKQAAKDGGA